MFEEETGHTVEVTLSNNEEMIAKLRATAGGGFDLAQPSQDRIAGPQAEFGIYKPIDLSMIDEPPVHHLDARGHQGQHHRRRRGLRRAACLGHLGAGRQHRRSRRW